MNRVFEGIVNLDDALFDSRCVECGKLLDFDDEDADAGYWKAKCCSTWHSLNTYTVLRTTEKEDHDPHGGTGGTVESLRRRHLGMGPVPVTRKDIEGGDSART